MREQTITFQPAFDKRHSDPKQNYGIGAMKIRFVLKGTKGATQFVMSTGWYLPHVSREPGNRIREYDLDKPEGYDIGYHSPKSIYGDESPLTEDCEVIGGQCFYDGSTLAAQDFLPQFIAEGEAAVWARLEQEYTSRFGEPSNAEPVAVSP